MIKMFKNTSRPAATGRPVLHRLVLAVAVCFAFMLASTSAHAQKPGELTLTIGKANTVEVPGDVADLLVADPNIADVGVLKSNRIFVVGRNVGDTNVLAFDSAGNTVAEYNVHVRVDEATLVKTLRQYFPNEKIKLETVGNDIILSGNVSSTDSAAKIREVAGRFLVDDTQGLVDMMTIDGVQQVMLKVRILEVNRGRLREVGSNIDYAATAGDTLGDFLTGALDTTGAIGLVGAQQFGTGSLIYQTGSFGPLSLLVQALEEDDVVNTLAEPNLTARSGESASFLAGGEFPVPASVDQNGNVSLEFREFGVSLNFRPMVMSANRIGIQLSTEVSTVDESQAVVLQNVTIPGRQIRRASTSVEMASGGTLMVAGLLSSRDVSGYSGLPGISNVPVIGNLMKSKSFQRSETEVVMIVTPFLVKPMAEKQAEIATVGPLGSAFLDNLSRTYGDRVPDVVTTGLPFGYLID